VVLCGTYIYVLAPQWEKLATIFANEPNVVIAKIDADLEKDIGQEYDISGFPTLKFFPAGETEPIAYDKARSVNAFVQYVNEQAGTQRLPEGGLSPIVSSFAICFLKWLLNIFIRLVVSKLWIS
jgi:protein disulfide-isomerase A6